MPERWVHGGEGSERRNWDGRCDAEACFVNNSLSLSDKIIASKRINRGETGKSTSIWTVWTWVFIWFCFQIFFLFPASWFRIFVQWIRISKSFLSFCTSHLFVVLNVALSQSTSLTTIFILLSQKFENPFMPSWACIKWGRGRILRDDRKRKSWKFFRFFYSHIVKKILSLEFKISETIQSECE